MTQHPSVSRRQSCGGFSGIIFASGNVWKQHRRIGAMGLKFLSQGKSGLERQIQEEALDLIEVFDSTQGQPMEPSFPIVLAVSNVICALLFGYRFSKEDEIFHQLIKSTEFILQIGGSAWQIVYEIFPWIMNHLPGRHQKAFACYDFSISFVMKEIRSREKSGTLDNPQNFIDFYLAQMAKSKDDPTSTLDENNLAYSIFDFFIAGSETTATTLHWALLYMVAYPDIQGQRACLGENLARMELFLLFTNLLRRFHFQLPEGVTEVNTKYIKGMTLQPHPQLLQACGGAGGGGHMCLHFGERERERKEGRGGRKEMGMRKGGRQGRRGGERKEGDGNEKGNQARKEGRGKEGRRWE
ncbi:cytochrome P450 2J2-like [Crotalus adamanteus]|uniref:Cytochrome P450 2J2-like n=1 Tax=Crotalus adamanteus TaxID=8729 RepID=A0AAW1BHL7_CROAD